MSLEELMNQDVTSVSKEPIPYLQAPAAIQVITQDEIRRSGASSIPEALRLADNLNVAQINSSSWAISARGFNGQFANKLLVLMDGRTVYTPLFSGVLWDMQDYLLEDLDRIEVVSGPGGTLWGANAVNGVINITSKSAKDTQGLYTETGGGTELREFAAARYGGVLASNVYYRVYGKYFNRGDESPGDPHALGSGGDSWRQGRGGFRIDAENIPGNTFTLQGDYFTGNEDIQPSVGNSGVSGGNILGRWSHPFSEDSDMTLQVYYDRTHLALPKTNESFDFIVPFGEPAGTLKDTLDTYDVDFQHHFQLLNWNRVAWGLGYRFTYDSLQGAPTTTFLPPILKQNLFSGFVQDEIKLGPKVILTLGTKLDHNDYTHWEVQPSGRLQWNVTSNQMIWGAISRAVREPSRIDRELRTPTGVPPIIALFGFPSSILNGSESFTSETVVAYELGYRAELGPKLSTSLSTFFNDYDNIRSVSPGPPPFFLPETFQNNLTAQTCGLELSADWQVSDWWRLHGGYSLLNERVHVKPGQVDATHALNETADPANQFSIRSSFDLPQNIELDNELRWVDSLRVNNNGSPATVPSYFEMDARIGWKPKPWLELALVGQNLLHDSHYEFGVPGTADADAIRRSFYGKVSIRW
ncbi:MAG TPA: TonB-dependent receptor [Verrucomicrobiae bacterium]|nr:TonB-dependent receptor [Verrucomicrobiae bacterium]